MPKEAIRKLLGHHSWDFTAGTYLHLDDDDLPDGAVVGDLTAYAPDGYSLSGAIASATDNALPRSNHNEIVEVVGAGR